jgi:general secretion pathway protein L
MPNRIVAVDLGSYSIKMVTLSAGFRSAQIVNVVERAVPHGERGDAMKRSAVVLQEMLRGRQQDHDALYLAVPGNLVSSRILEFGFRGLKRADLERAVGSELEALLPYDLDEMVYSFDSLPRDLGPKEAEGDGKAESVVGDGDPTFVSARIVAGAPPPGVVAAPTTGLRVFACAMALERARELLGLATVGGEQPRGLIVGPTTFSRIVERAPTVSAAHGAGEPVAVIDIGHQRTDVCVVKSGRVIFARTIERGGRDITEAIARSWNIPHEEAEKAKHADGFVASTAEPATSEAWLRIHKVVSAELDPLVRDLRRTLKLFRAETGGAVACALAVGGGARLRGMPSFLTEQLGLPVGGIGPDDGKQILGQDVDYGVAVDVACCAIGLALDGAAGGVMHDLRMGELAFKADFSFLRQKVAHLAAAVLLIVAFAAGNAYAALYNLRKAETVLTERVAVESMQATGKQLMPAEILELVGPTEAGAPESPLPKMTAYDLLGEISSKLPPRGEVTLNVTDLDIRPGQVSLRGTAASNTEVGAIEKALKSIECFQSVSRPSIQSVGDDVKEFKVTIKANCMW